MRYRAVIARVAQHGERYAYVRRDIDSSTSHYKRAAVKLATYDIPGSLLTGHYR